MTILGIETSCDETAAAVIKAENKNSSVTLLSNVSPSSMQMHAKTGGIIPEIAAREQIKYILPVIDEALKKANITNPREELDAIAITIGPGLIGSLLVGVETAKSLALAWDKPLIPVNHLFGHMYANWIGPNVREKGIIPFPIMALIVSGGHTDLVLIRKHQQIVWLGGTRDDATGEAFDKIGRLLKLPYPGGPAIEQAAKKGNPKTHHFPRPLMYDKAFDFSFSGLKTAVLRETQKKAILSEQEICNLARGTQDAIIDVLVYKTLQAAQAYQVTSIIISGGVAANQTLRDTFQEKIKQQPLPFQFFAPEKYLCTDNGAMIATAGFYNNINVPLEKITANPELYFD